MLSNWEKKRIIWKNVGVLIVFIKKRLVAWMDRNYLILQFDESIESAHKNRFAEEYFRPLMAIRWWKYSHQSNWSIKWMLSLRKEIWWRNTLWLKLCQLCKSVCKIWRERHLIYYFNIQLGLICIRLLIDWKRRKRQREISFNGIFMRTMCVCGSFTSSR